MTNTMNYEVGDIIVYRPRGGTGYRQAVVIARDPDIKNGRPGFDAEALPPDGTFFVWGYDEDIVEVRPARG